MAPLKAGDRAPEWTLMGVRGEEIEELSLAGLLSSSRAVVLHTYPLDFTGG
jgi:peroxiredoxin